VEKRRQQHEDLVASRTKAANSPTTESQEASVLDDLLDKLRSGDTVAGRRTRRQRPGAPSRTPGPLTLPTGGEGDAADIAKDMLARLKSDGFDAALAPLSPGPTTGKRRSRPRRGSASAGQGDEQSNGPVSPPLPTTLDGDGMVVEQEEQPPGD
jgi:cytokinesis protein